jgi:lipopolysaccharide/colanic/teichoic acid biosynthesis glycosyltransferase
MSAWLPVQRAESAQSSPATPPELTRPAGLPPRRPLAGGRSVPMPLDGVETSVVLALGEGPRVSSPALDRREAQAAKRCLDVLVAGIGLVLLAPLLALIAVAVRAETPGPALFRQRRVGQGCRHFVMWKFRTMVADAEDRRAALVALSCDPDWLDIDDDPRITRLGRLLRRTSLDELPQLVNVLRGEMSLVGPRPLIPADHARVPAWAQRRYAVKPGVTGLWQICGRTALGFGEMVWLDHVYVATWTLRRDVGILLRTLPAVLSGRGAN